MRDDSDTLGMTRDEMRRLGYRVVDLVVARLSGRDREPAVETGRSDELKRLLGGPLPRGPSDADEALDRLVSTALAYQQHGDHPRYFARVPGPSSFAGILGEWLATGFNTIATSWVGGSGPTALELVVLDWLRGFLGLPLEGEGILVSGGSVANLTAFCAAAASVGRGIVYLSDQAHASLRRNLRLLGYPDDDIRVIETDDDFRLPLPALREAIEHDLRAGKRPAILVGTAGTTNTGAVDPLEAMADLAASHGLWFHVDGAYGAAAAACSEGRKALAGIERADSLVVDPHKWMFQPYDLGCVLVRRPGALENAFAMSPEYLRDTAGHLGEPSLGNRGPELTRRSRAVKLWLTFRIHGADRMAQAIERGIALAKHAEQQLRADARTWRVVTPAALGIVTFAFTSGDDHRHERAASALTASGLASATTTTLKGNSALRLCILNPLTTEADLERTIAFLAGVT
jgi:aromatic-L-amino-acid decarboxylase